ncbi:hypothetical protein KP509_13G084100 [Ceratopteris richardii]|uniref:Glycosyltransferase family 92 protein n=1 Tax=Ceratopteris richardii TaxID=49495 RepID=A0A8T2TJH3_CERRI|nr:hypothetical protein KP509_13G084100 [Ceratopteris richardii]
MPTMGKKGEEIQICPSIHQLDKCSARKSFYNPCMLDAKSILLGMLLMLFLLVSEQGLEDLRSKRIDIINFFGLRVSVPDSKNNVRTETKEERYSTVGHNDRENSNVDFFPTIRRSFGTYGKALALFVHVATYRGTPNSFATVGLGSKPSHVFGNATFECEWIPATDASRKEPIKGVVFKMSPDWSMGRQYTVIVVNCSFEHPVGADGEGGSLIVYALHGHGSGLSDTIAERIVALTEKKGEYSPQRFLPPYQYEFVFCGSPLFGRLSAQRIREWITYHAKLFGKNAHFFMYDVGGMTDSVWKVLAPWLKLGYVTVHDIRDLDKFDGYYHNQFLVINDCFHRTRLLSNWTFFFDVDEYLWLDTNETLGTVMQGFSNFTQVIFRQKPMAAHLCQAQQDNEEQTNVSSWRWGIERLVYRNVKTGLDLGRKFAIQPRKANAVGVHRSENIVHYNLVGESLGFLPESLVPKLWFYHFHGTIYVPDDELCETYVPHSQSPPSNFTPNFLDPPASDGTGGSNIHDKPAQSEASEPPSFYDGDGTPFRLDTGLQVIVESVKEFELEAFSILPR